MNGIHSRGSSTLVEQIFNNRVILFPKELWQNKCANASAEKFWLGITAAAMLFPRDFESFAGYIARELQVQAEQAEGRMFYERLSAFVEQQEQMNFDHQKDGISKESVSDERKKLERSSDECHLSCIEQMESKYSDVPKPHITVYLQDVMKAISEGSLLPEIEDQTDLMQSKLQRFFFGSSAFFQKYCGWLGFFRKRKTLSCRARAAGKDVRSDLSPHGHI